MRRSWEVHEPRVQWRHCPLRQAPGGGVRRGGLCTDVWVPQIPGLNPNPHLSWCQEGGPEGDQVTSGAFRNGTEALWNVPPRALSSLPHEGAERTRRWALPGHRVTGALDSGPPPPRCTCVSQSPASGVWLRGLSGQGGRRGARRGLGASVLLGAGLFVQEDFLSWERGS